jgi:hypothetical protein
MTAMLDTIHSLEDEIISILHSVDLALCSVPSNDPVRSDLEEIRTAAQVAVARAERLAQHTAAASLLKVS